ncbi:hypothetical protein [Clostridium tyrobutyricum]|nr:hypothetical protein [Clostridium tyrobutyricum]
MLKLIEIRFYRNIIWDRHVSYCLSIIKHNYAEMKKLVLKG